MNTAGKNVNFAITAKNKSKTAFASIRSGLGSLASSATKMSAGIGVAATAAAVAITVIGNRALESADKIGKFADRAGLTTTALQEIRHAFDLAGVGIEGVDKGMLTFGKRLEKARDGVGALKGGLKGAKEALLDKLLATNSTSDALDVMFTAMANAETAAERLAIADAGFGSAGLRMTAAFTKGADAFKAAKDEAKQMGLVLSEFAVRGAEAANDAITRSQKVVSVAVGELVGVFSPAIKLAADSVREFSTGFIKDIKSNKGAMLSLAKDGILFVADSIIFASKAVGFLKTAFVGVKIAVQAVVLGIVSGFRGAGLLLTNFVKGLIFVARAIPGVSESFAAGTIGTINIFEGRMRAMQEVAQDALFSTIEGAIEADGKLDGMAQTAAKLRDKIKTALDTAVEFGVEGKLAGDTVTTALKKSASSADFLAQKGNTAGSVVADSLSKAASQADNLSGKLNKVGRTASTVSNFIQQADFTPSFSFARSSALSFSGGGGSIPSPTSGGFSNSALAQFNASISKSIFDSSGNVPTTRSITISQPTRGFSQPVQQQSFAPVQQVPDININFGGVTITGAVDARTAQQLAAVLVPELKRQLSNNGF